MIAADTIEEPKKGGQVRYRIEEGKTCIDVHVRSIQQIFDSRDPAPFRERDLDEAAVEYILDAVDELPAKTPMRIVFWISESPAPSLSDDAVAQAFRAHFEYALTRLAKRAHEYVRQGQLSFVVGLTVLVGFLSLAQLVPTIVGPGPARQILHEGLVITGWVAMWRPLEVLLYDWWPLLRQKRRLEHIATSDVRVDYGSTASTISRV